MSKHEASTDIAIVGMSGLFPGAPDIDCFWQNILASRDAVGEAPDGWLGDDSIFDETSRELSTIYTRKGGFLGDLARFDPREFGTMPNSISGAQPDQFLALRLARDALLDAGYAPGKFDGSATGVILGHAVHVHRANTNGIHHVWFLPQVRALLSALFPDASEDRLAQAVDMMRSKLPKISPESIPGLVPNVLTGRIANRLDLMGPNYIVDAACASSLVAVDLAMNELRAGRADMMLAGGVNTTTSPLVYGVFCSVEALSPSGRIRPFDRGANGTVLGEGAGVVVLKRLEDAIAADDRIYAVVKGVGVSSDGTSSGLMAPRLEGEVLAVRRAYSETGLDPQTIGLIEAHGTGIPLGDATEIRALRTVFGDRRGDVPTRPIGSVKSMIGHCIPAAGSAAMIKVSLALTNRVLPPTLCDEVNHDIGLHDSPFYVANEVRPWVHGGSTPRRAAIDAFGFGGINAHMILEESPVGRSPDPTAAFMHSVALPTEVDQVVFARAASRAALLERLDEIEAALAASPYLSDVSRESWKAASAATGDMRLAIVASDTDALVKKIAGVRQKLADDSTTSLQTRNGVYFRAAPMGGKVAFLFPGEMAQYPGMLADVALAYPEVRGWCDFICALFEEQREHGLREVLLPPSSTISAQGEKVLDDLLHRVDYGSELVFAADQAIFSLLTAAGIRPDSMLGHSTGENAALVSSGLLALDKDDVGDMIVRMNAAFSSVESDGAVPRGVLLTVAALERTALEALMEGREGLHFTMDNCPNQAVLFGDAAVIDDLQRAAVAAGAVCTRLPISWAYHTDHVRPMADAFGELFRSLSKRDSDVTLYSCATARPFPEEAAAFRQTAIEQYVSRVRFREAIEQLHADGHRIFVECGPNAVLSAFVRDILGDREHLVESADNRRRGAAAQLRHLLARLFSAGVPITPDILFARSETDDERRRREAREKQSAAPVLASELPFVTFSAGEANELQSLMQPAGPAAATAAPPVHAALPAQDKAAPPAVPAPAQMPTAAAEGRLSETIFEHVGLMRSFLQGQGWVMGMLLDPNSDVEAPQRSASSTRVEVADLADTFHLPFDFRAYLMRGAPAVDSVLPYLSATERREAEEHLARRGNGRTLQEWGLSRIAVKRAAGDLIATRTGNRPPDPALSILKTADGAPVLDITGTSGAAPSISISHAGRNGVGAAAESGVALGIDFELPTTLRDPHAFLDLVATEAERGLIGGLDAQIAATTVWSLKEATAKALRCGLQGRPTDFVITDLDIDTGTARLSYHGIPCAARVGWIGGGVCAVSYAAG